MSDEHPRGIRAAAAVRWAIIAVVGAAAIWSIDSYVRRSAPGQGGGDGQAAAPTAEPGKQLWFCPMHPNIVRDRPGTCPICGMQLEPLAPGGGAAPDGNGPAPVPGLTTVQLSPERIQLIGLRTAQISRRTLSSAIRTVGTVTARESGLSRVDTRFAGWVDRLLVAQTGVPVKQGQLLATLNSPDLVAAQQELLIARTWTTSGAAPPNAAQLLGDARERLRQLGMARGDIAEVERTGEPMRSFPVRAPAGGYVSARNVVLGAYVQPGTALFEISDLSKVWVMVDVFEHELGRVEVGRTARLTLPAWPDQPFTGTVDLLYPSVDPRTRTLKVRVVLANSELRLRPGMFGEVVIETATVDALAAPREAVVDVGERRYLFVALDGGRFEPRAVDTGAREGEWVEIRSGVREGERVVTTANFLIDSESRLRAAIEGQGAAATPGHVHGGE